MDKTQEIIDELSNHISKINHFNAEPIKRGVIDCLQRLKQSLSEDAGKCKCPQGVNCEFFINKETEKCEYGNI